MGRLRSAKMHVERAVKVRGVSACHLLSCHILKTQNTLDPGPTPISKRLPFFTPSPGPSLLGRLHLFA